jgi:hypothetical protein
MSSNISAREAFARLLADHVRNGTRPAKTAGEPWTYADLAGEVAFPGVENPVTENTISNWCNGRSLPRQIEPLLRALFGPETSERHAQARKELREAFIKARAEKPRSTTATKTKPAEVRSTDDGEQLSFERSSPADQTVEVVPSTDHSYTVFDGVREGRARSTETSPQPLIWLHWPVFLVSIIILIACGYGIAIFWRYVYYPTVDLVRTINFSELACDAEGNKHDVAYIFDDYTVVRNLFRFETYEKVADLRGNDFSVEVYDLNSDADGKIVAIHSDSNHEHRLQSYTLAVRNSHVRVKWVWRNAHSEPDEGTAVTGGWILRDLTVNYTLPSGREVTKIQKITPAVAENNCIPRQSSIYCPRLYTTEEVQIWWDWNVWDGCKK